MQVPTYSSSEDRPAFETATESAPSRAKGHNKKGSQQQQQHKQYEGAPRTHAKKQRGGSHKMTPTHVDLSAASTGVPTSAQSEAQSPDNNLRAADGAYTASSRTLSSEEERGQFAAHQYNQQQPRWEQSDSHYARKNSYHQQQQPQQYVMKATAPGGRNGGHHYTHDEAVDIDSLPQKGIKVVWRREVIMEDPRRKLSYLSSGEDKGNDAPETLYAAAKYFQAPNPKDIPLPSFI